MKGPMQWTPRPEISTLPALLGDIPICSDTSRDAQIGDSVSSIAIGEEFASGSIWKAHRVTDPSLPNCVVKIAKFGDFALHGDSNETTQKRVAEIIKSELDLAYSPEFVALETRGIIPKVLGVYAGKQHGAAVWALMMEDAGDVVVPQDLGLEEQYVPRTVFTVVKLISQKAAPRRLWPASWYGHFTQ